MKTETFSLSTRHAPGELFNAGVRDMFCHPSIAYRYPTRHVCTYTLHLDGAYMS